MLLEAVVCGVDRGTGWCATGALWLAQAFKHGAGGVSSPARPELAAVCARPAATSPPSLRRRRGGARGGWLGRRGGGERCLAAVSGELQVLAADRGLWDSGAPARAPGERHRQGREGDQGAGRPPRQPHISAARPPPRCGRVARANLARPKAQGGAGAGRLEGFWPKRCPRAGRRNGTASGDAIQSPSLPPAWPVHQAHSMVWVLHGRCSLPERWNRQRS